MIKGVTVKHTQNTSNVTVARLGWRLVHNCAVLVCCYITGCNLLNDTLEIVDGVTWTSKGISQSYIDVRFCDRKIEGDLHIEFLGEGLLVSKWISATEQYEWYYIDLRNQKVTDFPSTGLPERFKALQRRKKRIRSYSLTTLIGENKLDDDCIAFLQEQSALESALTKGNCDERK